ncbi:hypothetical protein P8452_50941 [Trifolium repens]|nr:hypothetical protein P8452_50941 [Trifolium repens]
MFYLPKHDEIGKILKVECTPTLGETDVFGFFRLGWLLRFISHSIISGFTSASAIVIGLSQAKYFLGYDIDRSSKIIPLVKSIIAGADKMPNKATEKASKNHKLKHLKRSSQQMSSHDATPHTMPSTTRTSNGTHTNTAPHIRESAARTSNNPPPHVATATRTSNIPPPEVASTVRTSNVPHHHVPHASCATRTSNIIPPFSSQPCDSETQSSGGKQTLILELQGFLPSYAAANEIGDIMRSNYSQPWYSWKKIDTDTIDLWFKAFKTKFKFCPPNDAWARKNFERRGAAIMKNNLSKVRLARKRPSWISQKLWKTLNEHWKTPDYKKKRMQAKTNRAFDRDGFGKPLHTCGSITTSQHRANLTETNGTPPDPVDLFVYTHQHRKNKTWVDRKSEHVYGKYKHRWEELTQQASLEGNPPPKEIDVWTEVAGIRKGRVYGLGSESCLFASRRNYCGSSSSSTEWVQRHEFEEMKFERDELRDMVKQLMERLKFKPKPYTRDQVHEDNVVDDNEDIVDNNDDTEDVVDNNNDNSDGNSDDNDGMSDDDDGMSDDDDDDDGMSDEESC